MTNLSEKNILITGGSAGIGLAMAQEFARRGAQLALVARNLDALKQAQTALEKNGAKVAVYSADVTDAEGLGRVMAEARDAMGGLDGVVANSGYCLPGYFHEITPEDARRQVDTNLMGCMNTLHHAIPMLLEKGGGFVAITSSPAGNAGIFGFSVYGATKAALNYLSHVLRAEYGDQGIRVHLLLPPDTQTPGYDKEVTLYPKETQAILSGGSLYSAEAVGRKFVDGIEKNRRSVTVGWEAPLLLRILRYTPWLWEAYTRRIIRKSQAHTRKE